MKNKAFTLIELLAVIIILGILMLIAVPSVSSYINNSKKNTYANTIKNVVDGAINKVNSGDLDIGDPDTTYYIHVDNIELEGGKATSPYGTLDDAYVVVTFDGDEYDYYFVGKDDQNQGVDVPTLSNDIDSSMIKEVSSISTGIGVGSRNKILVMDKNGNFTPVDKLSSIAENKAKPMSNAVNECTAEVSLTQGAEYINGQFTYRYGQRYANGNWANPSSGTNTDGWGVILTDKESTDPVNTKLCTSINGKPILYTSSMFNGSKTTSIDLSSFNTKDVILMDSMFRNTINLTSLDLTPLNTSSATEMTYMFSGTHVKHLDLSNLDTSNVTYMPEMFSNTKLETLDINSFNMSKVTFMGSFFQGSTELKRLYMDNWDFSSKDFHIADCIFGGLNSLEYISAKNWKVNTQVPQFGIGWCANSTTLETIDVTGWDLTKTTSTKGLFQQVLGLKNIVGLSTLDLSHITDASQMFLLDQEMTTLDLSGLDFSNVTNVDDMFFRDDKLTTVYVKNEADRAKLDASSNKPDTVNVVVK